MNNELAIIDNSIVTTETAVATTGRQGCLPSTLAAVLAAAPEHECQRVYMLAAGFAPLLRERRGRGKEFKRLAALWGIPAKTVKRKFYDYERAGGNPAALVDRRFNSAMWERKRRKPGLSKRDIEIFRTYAERNQRKTAPAYRALCRDFLAGKIVTDTPINAATRLPHGWSKQNLMRNLPDKFILKVARQGRNAAASERRLVYTTRRNSYIGEFYLFDDMWHDHFCNNLATRQAGRPMEFHAMDLYTANKFAWGMKVRQQLPGGKMENLNESEMRMLLAYALGAFGYSERGTTLVVERGTAAIRDDVEAMLSDMTGGLVKVARGSSYYSTIAAAAHQYGGVPKGNFCFKANLESLGNLIHNEMGMLPGQTGRNRDNRPEGLDGGLLPRNNALLIAMAQLPPEMIEMLHWDLLTIQQFRVIADYIYAIINGRTEHDLEGWDMNYVPDRVRGGMRRMSPAEMWSRNRRHLVPASPDLIARILFRDNHHELSVRSGMLQFKDCEITGDLLRYDARSAGLVDGQKYACVHNHCDLSHVYAYDAAGKFVGRAEQIVSVDRGNPDALQREWGKSRAVEKKALLPFIKRHASEAKQRAAAARHNAQVLAGTTPADRRLQRTFSGGAAALLEDCSEAVVVADTADHDTFDAKDLL